MTEKYKNIFLEGVTKAYGYTGKGAPIDKTLPMRSRVSHGEYVQNKLKQIWEENKARENSKTAVSLSTRKGTYLEFQSSPDLELTTKSLENFREKIRILNIRKEKTEDDKYITKATVFIPKGKEQYFIDKAKDYATGENPRYKNPPNNSLIASIEDIKIALLDSFWIGRKEWMPKENPVWCEIWLSSDIESYEKEFRDISEKLNIEVKNQKLCFPERTVMFCKANEDMLNSLIESFGGIAEIRRASETAEFFTELDNEDQGEWVEDLQKRININDTGVCISILDTGINNGHHLIRPVLEDECCHAYNDEWGTHDHIGHGTQMAGVCIFGDLEKSLETTDVINLNHSLESFKILPPEGENEPELYGAITSESVSRLSIENPNKKRILCMAVTAPKYETGDGSPSSWSAAIDELTYGSIDGKKKLFFVSGGNVADGDDWKNYHISNESVSVQNPGQSWNAITVGAYTNKYIDSAVAKNGELSPYSSTSMLWDYKKWPIKPEIVLEGGNLIKDQFGCFQCDELSMLTTNYKPSQSQFTTTWGTSSATAQASWIASNLQYMYPEAWPETIRGLMIHSAEWTKEMQEQFLLGNRKTDYRRLLRTCGYGVPNLQRAISCFNNSVNLIIESELQPFDKVKGRYVTKDMNLHEIPWPKDVLEQLFDTKVELKVTLSYFIEPGPGEIGWKDRYRYPSCNLRFDINGSDKKVDFLSKISKSIESDTENLEGSSGSVNWVLGPNNRNLGSIHSDTWVGTAAELATSNLIAVYPVIGWWRERQHLNRWNKKIRYSLIVSLSTPKITTDLYTPIMNEIESKIKNRNIVEIKRK